MSDILVWSEEYGIDGGIIDAQHKQLFRLVSHLLDIDDTSQQSDELKTIIMQLFQYMEFHFQREEKLAEDSGYPKIEILKNAHREIVEKMNGMMSSCANYRELCNQLRKILVNWVVNHTLNLDKDLGKHLEMTKADSQRK